MVLHWVLTGNTGCSRLQQGAPHRPTGEANGAGPNGRGESDQVRRLLDLADWVSEAHDCAVVLLLMAQLRCAAVAGAGSDARWPVYADLLRAGAGAGA